MSENPRKAAVIGLGIARAPVAAGWDVAGCDVSQTAKQQLLDAGAELPVVVDNKD